MKNILTSFSICFLVALASCSKPETQPKSATITDTSASIDHGSIYAMDMPFVDQNGKQIQWQSLSGKVRVIAMIFTHCPAACPITTEDIKKAENLIPPKLRNSLGFTLISFDSKRDTVGRLLEFYHEHNLDSSWELLRGSAEDVRMVGNLLNVKYQEWPSGDFTHDNVISIIDSKGRIVLRREGLGGDPKEIANKIKSLLERNS